MVQILVAERGFDGRKREALLCIVVEGLLEKKVVE
jgi:hypothetical protein